jgi:hypothetical protein
MVAFRLKTLLKHHWPFQGAHHLYTGGEAATDAWAGLHL